MFAASRIERVIGRIICLAVSIKTINCERNMGVLNGTKCLRKWFGLFIILKIINPNQKGRAKESVNNKCAETVKIYGISPIILTIKIMLNRVVNIFIFPILFLLLIVAEISIFK